MPTRRTPTERQKRLGAELRKLRIAAEATTDFAASLLGMDRTRISNMESGIRAITAERVRTLASNYDCADEAYIEALVAMADGRERGWWEQYRGSLPAGLLDIAELEWHAVGLQTSQVVHLPGLLQTEDYARTVFSAGLPPMSRLEIELRVNHRLERQRVLTGSDPLPYIGYVHEAALRMQFGGPKITRSQLEFMCGMSELENVMLRVLPVECGSFPGAGHALLLAEGVIPQLATVQLDSAHGPEFSYGEAQLAKYRAHLDWMSQASLSPEKSRDFILAIARQL
jgi:transcriptional regulator with XRE-family HTH domain